MYRRHLSRAHVELRLLLDQTTFTKDQQAAGPVLIKAFYLTHDRRHLLHEAQKKMLFQKYLSKSIFSALQN